MECKWTCNKWRDVYQLTSRAPSIPRERWQTLAMWVTAVRLIPQLRQPSALYSKMMSQPIAKLIVELCTVLKNPHVQWHCRFVRPRAWWNEAVFLFCFRRTSRWVVCLLKEMWNFTVETNSKQVYTVSGLASYMNLGTKLQEANQARANPTLTF